MNDGEQTGGADVTAYLTDGIVRLRTVDAENGDGERLDGQRQDKVVHRVEGNDQTLRRRGAASAPPPLPPAPPEIDRNLETITRTSRFKTTASIIVAERYRSKRTRSVPPATTEAARRNRSVTLSSTSGDKVLIFPIASCAGTIWCENPEIPRHYRVMLQWSFYDLVDFKLAR